MTFPEYAKTGALMALAIFACGWRGCLEFYRWKAIRKQAKEREQLYGWRLKR